MFHRVWEKGKQELHAGKKWVKQPSNRLRLLVMGVILAGLICAAFWVNRPLEGEAPTSASQMAYEKATVTAVLADDAAPDYAGAEGRRDDPSCNRSVEENLALFEDMKNGKFKDGEKVLRCLLYTSTFLRLRTSLLRSGFLRKRSDGHSGQVLQCGQAV